MFFNHISKAVLIIFTIAFASNMAFKFYHKKRKKEKPEINEVIMFSDAGSSFKQSKYSRCKISPSMHRLLYYLNSPRHNIDICMYVITSTDLLNAVLKLNIRGIKIRVIMDADMAFSMGSTVKRLAKQGIPVRWTKSTNLMHHKFCLIDTLIEDSENLVSTPLVIMGSLNWTNQAVCGNWEDVVVTSQKDLVRQYKNHFERLWVQFKPIVDLSL